MKALILILLTFSAFFSYAGFTSARSNQSLEVSQTFYSAKCDQRCQNGVTVDFFRPQDFRRIPAQLYKGLYAAAFDQAQIWGDTILEGDYAADGKVKLDSIMVVKRGAKVLGYAITYSERAWYVGECAYVRNNPSSLASCEEGRIHETSFVSDDLKDVEVDQNQFADFRSKD